MFTHIDLARNVLKIHYLRLADPHTPASSYTISHCPVEMIAFIEAAMNSSRSVVSADLILKSHTEDMLKFSSVQDFLCQITDLSVAELQELESNVVGGITNQNYPVIFYHHENFVESGILPNFWRPERAVSAVLTLTDWEYVILPGTRELLRYRYFDHSNSSGILTDHYGVTVLSHVYPYLSYTHNVQF